MISLLGIHSFWTLNKNMKKTARITVSFVKKTTAPHPKSQSSKSVFYKYLVPIEVLLAINPEKIQIQQTPFLELRIEKHFLVPGFWS